MEIFRVKIITGVTIKIPVNPDERISVSDDMRIFHSESVCDYNILIVDLNYIAVSQVVNLNRNDFIEFLDKPSVILCISDIEYSSGYSVSNYNWLPLKEKFAVINKKGEFLKPTKNSGHFAKLFNRYEWEWKCSFNTLLPETSRYVSIADNITGQSVSLMGDIREGVVIIIPNPKISAPYSAQYPEFLRSVIDLSKEEIERLADKEKEEPEWVEKYIVPEEIQLRDKISELETQYKTLTEAHKLLYEMGKPLTEVVHSVLSKIGFNLEMKEKEGIHDIEICEEGFNSVIEVTSSEDNWININKTRQLLHWCRKFDQEQNKKPKGVLIANPYSILPLADRDEPFTQSAIEQGEAENFCLMTTEQLYDIFCKFLKGIIDKDKIEKLLLSTKGLLSFKE